MDLSENQINPELLEEMFELNMEISMAGSKNALLETKGELEGKRRAKTAEVDQCFLKKDWPGMLEKTNELSYIHKSLENLILKLESM